ncbi:unnamed protein product [Arctia plantaginis]|uniref:Uncharacterized protein n=1 Tax=Arctia plantaginis TaxID=874455 RepID=A0A8S0ZF68_ARCPL|nr:unnamed protein product [Arctia plantaginis]CAB3232280.1 unnamed protein product [Arctia plantaginis]
MSNYYGNNFGYDNEYQQQYRPNYHGGRGGAQWGVGGFNRHPRPNLEAPVRGNFRGRNNSNRGGPRPQQAATPAAPEVAELPPVPAPKHLSKTTSPLTNDPLYLESFMNELGTEMRKAPINNEVHPGHYGFARIVEEDFKSVCARSHTYGKNISESMHSYYMGMITHIRMLEIHRQNGNILTNAESDLLMQFNCEPYPVTKLFEQYLSGFGNTSIPGSTDCEFVFNKPPNVAANNIIGFFGPLNANAVDYGTYVCPGVLAQRIVEDVFYFQSSPGC